MEYRNLIVTKAPNVTVTLTLDVNLYTIVDQNTKISREIPIHLESCKVGEIETLNGACHECAEDLYTFEAGGTV